MAIKQADPNYMGHVTHVWANCNLDAPLSSMIHGRTLFAAISAPTLKLPMPDLSFTQFVDL